MNSQSKREIRSFILEKRDSIGDNIRKEWDREVFSRFINSDYYKSAGVIFAFVSFKSEVDTHEIIRQALRDNKTICVPKIRSREKGMEIFKITSLEDLETGYFGILEPKEGCPSVDSSDLDLIMMPGAAFDQRGGRVGYGRGFYDRFLANMTKRVDKIALAYDFQVLDEVPMDEFDVRIDGIITNERMIYVEK